MFAKMVLNVTQTNAYTAQPEMYTGSRFPQSLNQGCGSRSGESDYMFCGSRSTLKKDAGSELRSI